MAYISLTEIAFALVFRINRNYVLKVATFNICFKGSFATEIEILNHNYDHNYDLSLIRHISFF